MAHDGLMGQSKIGAGTIFAIAFGLLGLLIGAVIGSLFIEKNLKIFQGLVIVGGLIGIIYGFNKGYSDETNTSTTT